MANLKLKLAPRPTIVARITPRLSGITIEAGDGITVDLAGNVYTISLGSVLGVTQTITSSGAVTVNDDTNYLIINKSSASSTAITLPATSARDGIPLEIYDFTGKGGNMTLTPSGGETIMGLSSWTITSGGSAGTGGSLRLVPVSSISGWLAR